MEMTTYPIEFDLVIQCHCDANANLPESEFSAR